MLTKFLHFMQKWKSPSTVTSQFHIKDLLMFLGANIFRINQGDRYVKFQSQDITINKTSIRQNQTLLSLQQQRIVQNLILKDNCT